MVEKVTSPLIRLSFLHELQQGFQKNFSELIDLYLQDAVKKVEALRTALKEKNISHLASAARELRGRSIDIGAIPFSYCCLHLEMAAQEMHLEILDSLISTLEVSFSELTDALEQLKKEPLSKNDFLGGSHKKMRLGERKFFKEKES